MIVIEEHIGLVKSIARKFKQVEYDDAFQSGFEGLIVASQRFNEDADVQFSTYATKYIFGYINNFINQSQLMRSPKKLKTLNTQITRYKKKGFDIEQIAEKLGVPLEEVKEAESIYNRFNSAEAIMGDNLYKFYDKQKISLEDEVIEKIEVMTQFDKVMEVIQTLPRTQKEIIIERFYHGKTQAQVGKERNRTRQAIQNAEKLGMKKLKESLGLS